MWAERQQVTEARAVKQMEQPDAVSPAEAKPDTKALLEIAGANAAAHLPMLLRSQTCREAISNAKFISSRAPLFARCRCRPPPSLDYRLPLA